jgi:hypothetical protein
MQSRALARLFYSGTGLHPTIRIIYLLALAVAVYVATPMMLVVLIAVLSALLLYCRAENFLKLLRRMRWLLLFLMIIYAFNTPGEYLRQWPFDIAPTYEGLHSGLLQIARIVIMLAGVALLLKTTSRDNLMAGFFLLLYPLKWIKLHPERLAVRLWLTLHYVEEAPPAKSIAGFLQSLDNLHNDVLPASAPEQIRFDLPGVYWLDVAAVLALVGIGIYLL